MKNRLAIGTDGESPQGRSLNRRDRLPRPRYRIEQNYEASARYVRRRNVVNALVSNYIVAGVTQIGQHPPFRAAARGHGPELMRLFHIVERLPVRRYVRDFAAMLCNLFR